MCADACSRTDPRELALGILIGMFGFVATQVPQWLRSAGSREERRAELYAWFDVPPLRQIAAAASGSWQWLLPLVCVGAGLFVLAQYTLAKRFTHGAQSAAADVGSAQGKSIAPDAAWRHAFVRSRWRVLLRTQLLLLRRDPLLLMRCAMQIVSLVPMLFGALMIQRAAGVGGVGLMAAAIVPLQLAALRNANDEANEFEASSPLCPRDRAGIRCAAAAAPLLVFVWAIAVVVAALGGPVPGLMVAVAGSVNAFASAWLGTCTTRVHTAEERSRNLAPRAVWQMFVGMLVAGLGTSGVGAVSAGYSLVGWSLFAGALAVAGVQFLIKPQLAASAT